MQLANFTDLNLTSYVSYLTVAVDEGGSIKLTYFCLENVKSDK